MRSDERWCAAIKAAEKETGKRYHESPCCRCGDCRTLEERAEEILADRYADEVDRAWAQHRGKIRLTPC
jgi:hypothetical protein